MAKRVSLKSQAKKFEKKLKKIKVFICDVDGVLTPGDIVYFGQEVGFNRTFHALDGYGLKVLQGAGIKVGFVTGGDSVSVKVRADYLKLDYIFIGNEDKREAFKKVMADGFKPEEILYMGDELFDIPLLKKAGFSACPPAVSDEVIDACDYVTSRQGGQACVREVIDMVRYAQKIYPPIPDFDE